MKTNYKDLIKSSNTIRKNNYINFFFKQIVGTNQKPFIGKEENGSFFDIVIAKNSREKKSKFGNRYIERNWRTCIFYFINRKYAIEYLNDTNKNNYRFSDNDEYIYWDSTNGFPSSKISTKYLEIVNHHIFKYFKTARSSWFVRSYVYFVLVICDDESEITSKDFCIHFWNNNYKFKKATQKPLFGNSNSISFVEDVSSELRLIKDENKDSIDCVKAYYGILDFYHDNEEAYVDIKSDIDNGIEYILCQGAARTGKTILALRFLHDYPEFSLLLMNYNFYISLKDAFGVLGATFPSNRIFHHDLKHKSGGCWISGSVYKQYRVDLSHLIVDEAQRLGVVDARLTRVGQLSKLDEIRDIISCVNHVQTIFFGDDSQRLNPRYDQGFAVIKSLLKDKNYREYYFSYPLGVPPEIVKNIRFLLSCDNTSPFPIGQFNISVIKDASIFVNDYLKDAQRKRHIIIPVIEDEIGDSAVIGGRTFKNIKTKEGRFSLFDTDVQNNYFMTAYSVISREIESVYLFLPSYIYLDKDNVISSAYLKKNSSFLINHLYTIMTRSTMNLFICCEDEKLGLYLSEKVDAIKNEQAIDEEEEKDKEYDYDIFIAYFGTERKDGTYLEAKRICDLLKEKNLNVFLFGYSSNDEDKDIKFSETWHVISRSETMIFVFNEYVDKDGDGLILRKTSNGETSRIYQELNTFSELINQGDRKPKTDVRFYYSGHQLNKFTIYPFLNRYMPILTQGNSNCCFISDDELTDWSSNRFKK